MSRFNNATEYKMYCTIGKIPHQMLGTSYDRWIVALHKAAEFYPNTYEHYGRNTTPPAHLGPALASTPAPWYTNPAAQASPLSPAEQIAAAQVQIEAAELLIEQAEAQQEARRVAEEEREASVAAMQARLDYVSYHIELAAATSLLLNALRELIGTPFIVTTQRTQFAKFRKELQPLAREHGYKIVLIGDKRVGTLVQL